MVSCLIPRSFKWHPNFFGIGVVFVSEWKKLETTELRGVLRCIEHCFYLKLSWPRKGEVLHSCAAFIKYPVNADACYSRCKGGVPDNPASTFHI